MHVTRLVNTGDDDGFTALMYASRHDHLAVVLLLVYQVLQTQFFTLSIKVKFSSIFSFIMEPTFTQKQRRVLLLHFT